jgi:hypothetical protein
MIAVCSIGDCEILILRKSEQGWLVPIFHTEMQRIDGNAQSPLQLARVDDSVDPNFDPEVMIEVIERGSSVHCVSAHEGDIVVLGSDGVFDNLYVDEIVEFCNEMLIGLGSKRSSFASRSELGEVAKRVVFESHAKTKPPFKASPIGHGGKCDDTCCVVGQVVEWTDRYSEAWKDLRRQRWWGNMITCGRNFASCEDEMLLEDMRDEQCETTGVRVRNYPTKPNGSFSTYWGGSEMGSFSEYQASFATGRTGSVYSGESSFASGVSGYSGSEYSASGRGDSFDDNGRCSVM